MSEKFISQEGNFPSTPVFTPDRIFGLIWGRFVFYEIVQKAVKNELDKSDLTGRSEAFLSGRFAVADRPF